MQANSELKKTHRRNFLKIVLAELTVALAHKKSLKEVFQAYSQELQSLDSTKMVEEEKVEVVEKIPAKNVFANWYQDNSILALLYLGTLLIVFSAAIFVVFNWTQISGLQKAFSMVVVTFAFLVAGVGLYQKSTKLKMAGITFASIGALLIPFVGISFYNFVYRAYDQQIWLITSLLSLGVYLAFSKIFEKNHYKYLASLATIAFVNSFINIMDLDPQYNALGAVVTAFILLGLSRLEKEQKIEGPFIVSAQVLLPIALFYSLVSAMDADSFATHLTNMTIGLSAIFYAASYVRFKKENFLIASTVLVTGFFGNFVYTMGANETFSLYIMASFLLLLGGLSLKVLFKKHLVNAISTSVVVLFLFMHFWDIPGAYHLKDLDASLLSFMFFITLAFGFLTSRIKPALVLGQMFLALSLGTYVFEVYTGTFEFELFSVILLILALANYVLGDRFVSLEERPTFIALSSVLSFFSLFYASLGSTSGSNVFILLSLTAFQFYRSVRENNKIIGYISGILGTLTLFKLFDVIDLEPRFMPLYMLIWLYTLTLASTNLKDKIYEMFNYAYYVILIWTSSLVFDQKMSYGVYGGDAEKTLIFSGYLLSGLFTYLGIHKDSKIFKYIASISWMLTYFWQLDILEVDESLYYTIPLGIYFLILGSIEKKNIDWANIFEFAGLITLLGGVFGKISGYDNIGYAILLALEGVALLAYGISYLHRRFTYAGIAFIAIALLGQLYEFISSLPRWVITSTAGILVLGVALFLLNKRPEEN